MSARTHKGTCLSFLPGFCPIIGTLSHENASVVAKNSGDGQDVVRFRCGLQASTAFDIYMHIYIYILHINMYIYIYTVDLKVWESSWKGAANHTCANVSRSTCLPFSMGLEPKLYLALCREFKLQLAIQVLVNSKL